MSKLKRMAAAIMVFLTGVVFQMHIGHLYPPAPSWEPLWSTAIFALLFALFFGTLLVKDYD